MGKIPVLKPKQVIKNLENLGFFEVRQRGSHKQFRTMMVEHNNSPGTCW